VLTVRLPLALRSEIVSWAKQQKDKPSRSEAIRRLIEFALACKAKGQNTGDKQIPRPLQRASNLTVAAKAARRKTAKTSGEKR
jgi:metal-responsive CopG/Arc/MetJ family transcriptional regulator